MFNNFFAWLYLLVFGPTTDNTPEPAAVQPPANKPAKKAVSIVHAMLGAIEKHEAGHPILLSMTEWADELVEAKGEALLTDVEHAALTALALKYPILAPLLASLNTASAMKTNPVLPIAPQ